MTDDVKVRTIFPARVVEIIDEFRVVINRGEKDGVKRGQRFMIYGLGPDLTDPDTGDDLASWRLYEASEPLLTFNRRWRRLELQALALQ